MTGDDAQYIATDVYFSQKNNGVSPCGKNAVNGCDRYVTRVHYRSDIEAPSKRHRSDIEALSSDDAVLSGDTGAH
ncbi:MAG: hypothetical protein ABIQ08_13400 [Duganella sp.]